LLHRRYAVTALLLKEGRRYLFFNYPVLSPTEFLLYDNFPLKPLQYVAQMIESAGRSLSVEENMRLFAEMEAGTEVTP
jgi:hypothetical protein